MSTETLNDPTPAPPEELLLMELRYKAAEMVEMGGHRPLLLQDDRYVWVVYKGVVNVFAVQLENGETVGSRIFLANNTAGDAIFGVSALPQTEGYGLLAVGNGGSQLLKIRRERFDDLITQETYIASVVSLLDNWIVKVVQGISRTLPERDSVMLESGRAVRLDTGQQIRAKRGVMWVDRSTGSLSFLGQPDVTPIYNGHRVPISSQGYLQAREASEVKALTTEQYLHEGIPWEEIALFHQLAIETIANTRKRDSDADRERLANKVQAQQLTIERSFARLVSILNSRFSPFGDADTDEDELLQASKVVGAASSIEMEAPPPAVATSKRDPLLAIAKASRVRTRRVLLKGEWYRQDNGPLLGYIEATNQPVALIPTRPGTYRLWDLRENTKTRVTAEVAHTLGSHGYMFYRPFPNHTLSLMELLRFGTSGIRSDLLSVLGFSAVISVVGLVVPIATGLIFDSIIPGAARPQLIQLGLILLAVTVVSALFQLTKAIAMLRIEGRMDAVLQSAVWDRLLSLPTNFFRDYTTGDLGTRAMGINQIRQTLSGVTINTMLAALFSLVNLGLMVYYSATLAAWALLVVVVAVAVVVGLGMWQVRLQRTLTMQEGVLAGIVLQFVNGISKFRLAGAESRAFSHWARSFAEQKRLAYNVRSVGIRSTIFTTLYPTIATIVLFAAVAWGGTGGLTTGAFLAFFAAFTQLLFAGLQVGSALLAIATIVPVYERLRPILQALPETNESKAYPGELTGAIEVSHVSFRYNEKGPLILKDVSLDVKPGEFIALVGPSGSGKSTLFRLLVGFDNPESGTVSYDQQDLAGVDIQEVRRQMGVVLQNGKVMAGSIFNNIVGSSSLTIEDAWDAAKNVGLDKDVHTMPMNMHTVIADGGGTLSGGQRQRLLIARAIVNKPRILFFDEATSALDNETQAIVSKSLEDLQATRIVIAHRLSTIMNADRIYVLQNGEVVQQGTYKELIGKAGVFADLARRQLA